jgi:hypothetical protein
MVYENIRKAIVECIWIGKQRIILFLKFRKNQRKDVESALSS